MNYNKLLVGRLLLRFFLLELYPKITRTSPYADLDVLIAARKIFATRTDHHDVCVLDQAALPVSMTRALLLVPVARANEMLHVGDVSEAAVIDLRHIAIFGMR